MRHQKIDDPLDNYEPFQPFDSGPPEGDSDVSECSSADVEASQKLGDRPRDWPKGNKINICYACGNTFSGPGWKIKPLCAVCEPETQTQPILACSTGVPADSEEGLVDWHRERDRIENESQAEMEAWAECNKLNDISRN